MNSVTAQNTAGGSGRDRAGKYLTFELDGTEFAIEADPEKGTMEVGVFRGEVKVKPNTDTGGAVDKLYDPSSRSRPTYVLLGPGAEILYIGSSITEARVQDALPTARATVEAVAALLAREPEGAALAERVRADRLRRKTTRRFSQAGPALVPEVGVAPELFNALFGLRAVGAVSPIFTVRQDYVVARLVERTAPDPATWPAERAAFVARWRAAERSRVVDAWLSTRLQGAPLWIDQPAVERLAIPGAPPVGAKPGAATP